VANGIIDQAVVDLENSRRPQLRELLIRELLEAHLATNDIETDVILGYNVMSTDVEAPSNNGTVWYIFPPAR
jgi:hypothetical protein